MHIEKSEAVMIAINSIATINHRRFQCPASYETTHLGDGSSLTADHDGNIVLARYSSGTQVKRNADTVFVKGTEGDYWLGDISGRWYRLD